MTRSNRVRSIAALAAGALVAMPLLTACGAGQIASTADMVAPVAGGSATATITSPDAEYDNTTIGVRNVTVDYGAINGYPAGGTAPLSVYIVNNTPAAMTLVGVAATFSTPETDAVGTATVVLTGGTAPAAPSTAPSASAPSGSAAPSASGSPSGSRSPSSSGSAGASGAASASPSASGSASPSPAVTTPTPVGQSTLSLAVPQAPAELTALTPADGQYLQLTQLSAALSPGSVVHLIFTFKLGNGATQTIGEDPKQPVDAPFGPPGSPAPRTPISLAPNGE